MAKEKKSQTASQSHTARERQDNGKSTPKTPKIKLPPSTKHEPNKSVLEVKDVDKALARMASGRQMRN